MITYQEEKWKPFSLEAEKIFIDHYKEVPFFDAELDIDHDTFVICEKAKMFRLYTIRDDGVLIGYSSFFISVLNHHKTLLNAVQDVLFLKKENRGSIIPFLRFCEKQLKLKGVSYISHCVPASKDWSLILKRIGYAKLETVYTRKL